MFRIPVSSNTFESFTDQIPSKIYQNAKVFKSNNIAIFSTNSFVPNVTISCPDYHFAVPIVDPPLTEIGSKQYQFKKDRLVIFNPDTQLRVLGNVKTDEFIVVCIKRNFLEDIAYDMTSQKNISFSSNENIFSSQLLMTIKNFISESSFYSDSTSLMINSLSIQLGVNLLRDATSNLSQYIISPDRNNRVLETAIDYIKTYYHTNISIEDICNYIHFSPTHFMRSFKAKTGLSPHKYLIQYRLQKAKELLKNSNYNISEICKLCGFVNPSHFSSTFKSNCGISPIEFRKQAK